MNGINCPISLKRTFKTAKKRPKPIEVIKANNKNAGRKMNIPAKWMVEKYCKNKENSECDQKINKSNGY